MPFTTVAASPTVTVIARLFLSPLVAWMPTPACAMPAGKKRTTGTKRAGELGFFAMPMRSTRDGATREAKEASGDAATRARVDADGPGSLSRARNARARRRRGPVRARTGVLEGVQARQVVLLRGEGAERLLPRRAAGAANEDVLRLDQGPGQVRGAVDVRFHHRAGRAVRKGTRGAAEREGRDVGDARFGRRNRTSPGGP